MLIASILFISAITLTFIFNGLKNFQIASQIANSNHITYLSNQLIKQQAQIFATPIENNSDTNEINTMMENLINQDFINNATLYKINGEILAKSEEKEGIADNAHTQNIIVPIYSKQHNPVGFLKVTFQNKYKQKTEQVLSKLLHRLYAQMMITLLCGITLGIMIVILFYKKKSTKSNYKNKPAKSISYSPAKYFHQRRKRR